MKTLLKNELISYVREPFASFFSIILPIILVFIYGDAFGEYKYSDALSGYDMSILFNIVFLLGNLGLMGLVMTIIEKRSSMTSKRERILPINNISRFILNTFSSVVLSLLITIIVIVINIIMFPISLKFNFLYIIIYLVLLFNFFAIGYNIATLNISPRTAQTIGIFVFFICLFFSGMVIPFDDSQPVLKTISTYSPFNVSLGCMTAIADFNHFSLYYKQFIAIGIYSILNIGVILFKGRIKKYGN
ncbi:ABC transporter permease [Enterococcus faecium]|uniref:ABC-2 type transporter transmembrane domain-containing protein n=1 Tax=Enterococcus faecium TaxID=1352 RepID=A0A242ARG2_ENTFC|nr:ABC transporter permease [Enterococcus faecium]OTN83643.1 hypothetical protein A5810_003124 [Enterococcus faecium]